MLKTEYLYVHTYVHVFFLSGPDFTYMNFRKDKKTLPPKSYFQLSQSKIVRTVRKT